PGLVVAGSAPRTTKGTTRAKIAKIQILLIPIFPRITK
ncbi:unnamed protein product, partial [marine sediment metagenome]